MDINSVNNVFIGSSTQATQANPPSQVVPEAQEARKIGPDRDGDTDDAAKTVKPALSPSVNAKGQNLGQVINATA